MQPKEGVARKYSADHLHSCGHVVLLLVVYITRLGYICGSISYLIGSCFVGFKCELM